MLDALLASLCMGFMLLFRKSKYLTSPNKVPKIANDQVYTLVASDINFWFNDKCFPAYGTSFPARLPDVMFMYLPISNGDPFRKMGY